MKRDSPAILVSSDLGSRASRSTPSTATGSVGETITPNTSAARSGMPVIALNPVPTMAVDSATPSVAISSTSRHCCRRSEIFTCRAPAKSSRPSMPSSRACEKSMPSTSPRTVSAMPKAGAIQSTAMTQNDASSAITRMPMEAGSRSARWLTAPKAAASTIMSEAI